MSAGNSAYSPLPQSNSDSDCSSEEELHVSQGNRIVNRAAKVQNSNEEKGSDEQKNNFINYKLLDNDGEVGVALNRFLSARNEVSILKPDNGLEIFSTSRKICFVFSLLLCVFTTVAFIWILPCNLETCISASDLKSYNFTWEENLTNLETYGSINLVTDGDGSQNILFLTRSQLDLEKNCLQSALRCMKGKDGSLVWNFKMEEEPIDVDCKLIDINNDGINDCLVYDSNFLISINPVSGKKLWDIQKSNKNKLYFRDFPLVVSDLNRDSVKDLLLPCAFASVDEENNARVDFQNYLVIISGKTGIVINEPLQIIKCTSIHNLMFENSSLLSYTCFNSDTTESFQKISFMQIYRTLIDLPKDNISLPKWDLLKQHVKVSDSVGVNGFRLILENQGNCPEDCYVLVYIKDEREPSSNKTIYYLKQQKTFGMPPVILKTKKETGFIIKFWHFGPKTLNSDTQNNAKFSNQETSFIKNMKNLTKRSKKVNHLLNNSTILDEEMLLESKWESQRRKRTATNRLKNRFGKNGLISGIYSVNLISETIVKIAINQSEPLVSEITNDSVFQICRKAHFCQPNVYRQSHSVVVAPIVEGGVEKLISFTSKYVHQEKEKIKNIGAWQFQTRIRVLNI